MIEGKNIIPGRVSGGFPSGPRNCSRTKGSRRGLGASASLMRLWPWTRLFEAFTSPTPFAMKISAMVRPVSFCPTFSKHQGVLCHGVQMHITDRDHCDTVLGGLKLMETIFRLWPDKAEYLSTDGRFFLDRLLGTDLFRTGQMDADTLIAHFAPEVRSFEEKSRQYRLYE